jgi:hypothetical protein
VSNVADLQDLKHTIAAMRVPFVVDAPADKLCSALVSAFEGGSNYWIRRVEVVTEPSEPCAYHSHSVFLGAALRVVLRDPGDVPGGQDAVKLLTLETLRDGMALLAQKWPHHVADLLTNRGDATTGDVILQAAILGDLVYG